MAITFPLSWSTFGALLPIRSAAWKLRRFDQVSWDGNSAPGVSELADPRWSCRVTLDVLHVDEAAEVRGLIELHGSAHPFLLHDPERPGPRLDRDGGLLGAATPTIASISTTGFSLAGLPAGYVLHRGDLISVPHGATPRRALYTLAEAVIADGVGDTAEFMVLPSPRLVAQVGDAVTLLNPTGLMLILPDSFEPGQSSGSVVRGMGFDTVESW